MGAPMRDHVGGWGRAVTKSELIELVEIEVRELLTAYKIPGDKTPVIK